MLELIAHMDEFRPGLEARVWTAVPATSSEVLRHALPTDWIDAHHTRPVIDGVVAELDTEASELWASLVQARLLSSPLLRGLVHIVRRLGAASPHRFLKAMPRGWDNAYKGWCHVELIGSERRAVSIEFCDVAPYLCDPLQHWIAIEGVLRGLVAAAGEEGKAELSFTPESSLVSARVEW